MERAFRNGFRGAEEFPFFTGETARERLAAAAAEKTPVLPRSAKEYDNAAAKEAHAELKELWENLLGAAGLLNRAEADCRECAPVLALLIRLTNGLEAEFTERKRQKNKVDFSDIELTALRLLRDEKAAREISAGISAVIVDEFQDSNEIQYEIFRRLSDGERTCISSATSNSRFIASAARIPAFLSVCSETIPSRKFI